MRTLLSAAATLGLVALCSSVALAQGHTIQEDKGEQPGLDWEIAVLQIDGLADSVIQARVNSELSKLSLGVLEDMRSESNPEDLFGGMNNSVWVHPSVGILSPRVLSASWSVSTFWSGAAHPDHGTSVVTFDLRTGERVETREFFTPGAEAMARVAAKVDAELRKEYSDDQGDYYLETVTAENIRNNVVVTPAGLQFLFGSYEIGPYAAGVPEVTLPYYALEGLLATDGVLAGLVEGIAGAPGEVIEVASELQAGLKTGRVITAGGRLNIRSAPWGEVIMRVTNQAILGVTRVARKGELFHEVQFPNGKKGYAHRSYLLIEEPVTLIGSVARTPKHLTFRTTSNERLKLIAKAGPGHRDSQLAALAKIEGQTIRLEAIRRSIGFRTWITPIAHGAGPAVSIFGPNDLPASSDGLIRSLEQRSK